MVNLDRSPTYNPAPQILEEAIIDEWPGQEIGVFLSIGTGKRPNGTGNMQSEWWEGFAGGLGDFAEAKRKLILKIEGCEKTHHDMLSTHLRAYGVEESRYFRLNVEVGVGEFGMNEWNRLTDIRNSTELYLNRADVKDMISRAADNMANIERLKLRSAVPTTPSAASYHESHEVVDIPPPLDPNAVELPGDDTPSFHPRPLSMPGPQFPASPRYSYQQAVTSQDKFAVLSANDKPPYGDHTPPPSSQEFPPSRHYDAYQPYRSNDSNGPSPRRSHEAQAPPLPPKTPISTPDHDNIRTYTAPQRSHDPVILPYPDDDGPPPAVNMARKPEYIRR